MALRARVRGARLRGLGAWLLLGACLGCGRLEYGPGLAERLRDGAPPDRAVDVPGDGPWADVVDAGDDALDDAPDDAPIDAPIDAGDDAPDDVPGDAPDDAPDDAPIDAGDGGGAGTGTLLWGMGFGGADQAYAKGIAADLDGNVVVAGTFMGVLDLGLRGLMVAPGGAATNFVLSIAAADHSVRWAKELGAGSLACGGRAAVLPGGGAVLVGCFEGAMFLGAVGTLTSLGELDAFVVALDPVDGTELWGWAFGDAAFDAAHAVAVDRDGNVVVTGSFEGPLDLGAAGVLTSAGGTDVLVLALDPSDGGVLWGASFGGLADDAAYGIAADGAGNLSVTGSFGAPMVLGTAGTLVPSGGLDAFVVSLDGADGTPRWGRAFGGGGWECGNDLASDAAGNVYVTGGFDGPFDLGVAGTLTSAGGNDTFVLSLDGADGAVGWGHALGGVDWDQGYGIDHDPTAGLVVTGGFSGTLDLGAPGGVLVPVGGWDIFAVGLDPLDGALRWARLYGSANGDGGAAVVIDRGAALVAANFQGSMDLGSEGILPSGGVSMSVLAFGL